MTGRGDCGRGRFGDTGGHIAPQTSVWKADCPDYALPLSWSLRLESVSYTHLDVYKRQLLGVQAGEQHALMVDLLPKAEPDDKHLFDLLKKAYIDARYSMSYLSLIHI